MFSKFFIERPIFATVLAIIICLAGLVAMTVLPVEQYPRITPVQVTVSATYPGADSQTLADSVAAPIEAQINGVDNMLYMSSTSSSNGQLMLTVYFTLNTDQVSFICRPLRCLVWMGCPLVRRRSARHHAVSWRRSRRGGA